MANLEVPRTTATDVVFINVPSALKLELRMKALREKTTMTRIILDKLTDKKPASEAAHVK